MVIDKTDRNNFPPVWQQAGGIYAGMEQRTLRLFAPAGTGDTKAVASHRHCKVKSSNVSLAASDNHKVARHSARPAVYIGFNHLSGM